MLIILWCAFCFLLNSSNQNNGISIARKTTTRNVVRCSSEDDRISTLMRSQIHRCQWLLHDIFFSQSLSLNVWAIIAELNAVSIAKFAPTESHTERLNSLETMDSRLALKMNANAARTRVIIQMQMRSPNIDVYIYIYIYIRSIRFVERVERLTVFSVPNVLFRLVTLSVSGLVPCAP